jgi:phage tail-like protein
MATENSTGMSYPLTKMNFLVTVDEVNGVAAFNEVTGIEGTVDVIEFRQGNSASLSPVKLQGLVKHGNMTLKMGYIRNSDFKTWIQNCVSEKRGDGLRHNVSIELIDISGGAPQQIVESPLDSTLAWILKDAWVTKYTGPDLNAMTSEVAIESVEIAYEELTIPN